MNVYRAIKRLWPKRWRRPTTPDPKAYRLVVKSLCTDTIGVRVLDVSFYELMLMQDYHGGPPLDVAGPVKIEVERP